MLAAYVPVNVGWRFMARVIVVSWVLDAWPALAMAQVDDAPRLLGKVIRVIDGDSVEVQLDSGPIEVRLHAADAPEYDQPGGRAAVRALSTRLKRKTVVSLEPVEQDQYARLVAVVHRDDENVNGWLIRQGHAWAYRQYTADERYCRWEDEARATHRGLWSRPASDWIAPWDWRRRGREPSYRPVDHSNETLADCLAALRRRPASIAAATPQGTLVTGAGMQNAAPAKCAIKGNIGPSGAKIYHVPGAHAYEATRIDPATGERWFCSEDDARRAGWRAPRQGRLLPPKSSSVRGQSSDSSPSPDSSSSGGKRSLIL
jgi:endonuclease YncB( thermonuclease family)